MSLFRTAKNDIYMKDFTLMGKKQIWKKKPHESVKIKCLSVVMTYWWLLRTWKLQQLLLISTYGILSNTYMYLLMLKTNILKACVWQYIAIFLDIFNKYKKVWISLFYVIFFLCWSLSHNSKYIVYLQDFMLNTRICTSGLTNLIIFDQILTGINITNKHNHISNRINQWNFI
jgi:hypothetical protein